MRTRGERLGLVGMGVGEYGSVGSMDRVGWVCFLGSVRSRVL